MADLTPRDELLNIFSDVHKEAVGFRPRQDVSHLTDAELSAEIDSLYRYGWTEELYRAADAAGENFRGEDVARMTVAEIIHRTDELRARGNRRPTEGYGWRLV